MTNETPATKKTTSEKQARKPIRMRVAVPLLNVRAKATMASEVVGTLSKNELIQIASRTPQGFGKLADGTGYVKLEFLADVDE